MNECEKMLKIVMDDLNVNSVELKKYWIGSIDDDLICLYTNSTTSTTYLRENKPILKLNRNNFSMKKKKLS
jgi:hypothetical protein